MTSEKEIVWGEEIETPGRHMPDFLTDADQYVTQAQNDLGNWLDIKYNGRPSQWGWSCIPRIRLRAEHPYYKAKLSPVEQALETLKAEGYTVDETTSVISPPNKRQEARDFVADMYAYIRYTVSSKDSRNGKCDHVVKGVIEFLNENKHRIPENMKDN